MQRGTAKWLGLSVLFAGLIVLSSAGGSVATAPSTSYTITFTELGLPSGTNWSIDYNGVTYYSTSTTLSVPSIAGGTYYYWSTPSTITTSTTTEYEAATTGTYMYVPQEQSYDLAYSEYVHVAFQTKPASDGSFSPNTGWYAAGSQLAVQVAPYSGWAFSSWSSSAKTDTFDNSSTQSTVVTLKAPTILTAKLKATTSDFNFYETGLPTSTTWSVVLGGISHASTTTTLKTGSHKAGSYSWSIATISVGHNTEYVPYPSSGYVSLPGQSSLEIVWTKEFQLTFVTSPASSGDIYPYNTAYYPNGTNLILYAGNTSSYLFSSWTTSTTSLNVANKLAMSTNVTVSAPGTITAKFTTGTPCSANCSLTFTELGLPSGTTWGVEATQPNLGTWTYFYSNKPTLTLPKLNAGVSWQAETYISSPNNLNVIYSPVEVISGSDTLGQTSNNTILYDTYYYVTVATGPLGSLGATSGLATSYSGWYPAGDIVPLASYTPTYWSFSSWSSNSSLVKLSSAKATSITMTVNGYGTVLANFVNPRVTVTFEAFNLPKGLTWGLTMGGYTFTSSAREMNVSFPEGSWSWSALYPLASATTSGVEYTPINYYGSFTLPSLHVQAIVYEKYYNVVISAGGTSGGSVSPSGTYWIEAGSVFGVQAINGTSVSFNGWTTTATTGSLSLGSSSQASTFLTVDGTGKVVASFH